MDVWRNEGFYERNIKFIGMKFDQNHYLLKLSIFIIVLVLIFNRMVSKLQWKTVHGKEGKKKKKLKNCTADQIVFEQILSSNEQNAAYLGPKAKLLCLTK